MSGFTSNTLLIRIQYCYQFKYFADFIKTMRRMVKWNMKWNKWIRIKAMVLAVAKCIHCDLGNCRVNEGNTR